MRNIQVVDGIVKDTEELLRNFFQDDETAFVFTADHGMSNIGNHGDGSKSFRTQVRRYYGLTTMRILTQITY